MSAEIFTQSNWKLKETSKQPNCWEFDSSKMHFDGELSAAERDANLNLMQAAPKMYKKLLMISDLLPYLDQETHPQIELDAVKHDIDILLAEARGETK